ncbi:polysaccharide deacetylase family protein [Bacillus pseudomycoides]|uniref:Polysaccharide deacetylase family protein n=1 Tax=Bacillus bingmayongensis TaxID=1150157 RepID=A0ABU5JUA4_9BACI|nr:polysaccharide deacetylase family protein [Bacillus pseudomycoides]
MKARESKGSKKLFIFIAAAVVLIGAIGFFIFNKMNAVNKQEKIPVLQYTYLLKDQDKNASPSLKDKQTILSVSAFEKQMKYLADNKYHAITLSEFNEFIKEKKKLPAKSVLITFDNSSKSNYIYAYPILKKYKMHAASFVVTSRITEKTQKFDTRNIQPLSKIEMEKMKDVFEFGSHTHDLYNFSDDLPALLVKNKNDVKSDILKSKEILQTKYISYPFGKYNENAIEVLKDLNMSLAFGNSPGYATQESKPFEIERWYISSKTTMNQFVKIVSGEYEVNKK